MAKVPPAALVGAVNTVRDGLGTLRRNLVPAPIALLETIDDLWSFHVTYALAELNVPDALRAGPRSVSDVASELGLEADALYRLLRAGTMLGLAEELPDRRFALLPIGLALCADPEASFRDFVVFTGRHGSRFWRRLPDCVRTGRNAIELETGLRPFDYLSSDPAVTEDFNRAMTAVSNLACDAFLAAYDLSFATRIVDVGGGHGRLLAGILRQVPAATGVLYDLPSVVAGAPPLLESMGVASRVQVEPGNFFDRVPAGDCYVAKAIIHDWQDDDARRILANIRASMAPNARVLLYEAVVGPPNKASFGKLLDLEMLVTAGGRERTADEFRALLASAGLRLERIVATAGPTCIVDARAADGG